MIKLLVLALVAIASVSAFSPFSSRTRASGASTTKLYEDFRLDQTTIVSDPLIFSEAQIRENFPEDEERWNPFSAFLPDFSQLLSRGKVQPVGKPSLIGNLAKASLRSSVSLDVLESRTREFIEGGIDAKKYATTLKAAFGNKLGSVVPEILESLPADKSAALSKAVR